MPPSLKPLLTNFLLLAIATQIAPAQFIPQPPPARSPVQIFVTATAKKGSPLTLDPSALSVLVDNQSVPVTSIRSAKDEKLLFAVIIDISNSQAPNAQAIKDTAVKLFDGLSVRGYQGYLVVFNTEARVSQRSIQSAQVRSALNKTKFGGGTALFDTLAHTCEHVLSKSANPDVTRRAIFLISDGDDNFSATNLGSAEDTAHQEGVTIYSLTDDGTPKGQKVLNQLSEDTGGLAVRINNLPDGVTPLLAALDAQWAISLDPAQAPDGKLYTLAVKTSQKDTSISAPSKIALQ